MLVRDNLASHKIESPEVISAVETFLRPIFSIKPSLEEFKNIHRLVSKFNKEFVLKIEESDCLIYEYNGLSREARKLKGLYPTSYLEFYAYVTLAFINLYQSTITVGFLEDLVHRYLCGILPPEQRAAASEFVDELLLKIYAI